ncbi:dTDP-4-dehydrorhamnose 3,5-epimerase [Pseudooceanicola sp. CBS1P-1]|uniref:dTDP-4-dehydrorhamnose 3,5-epimerase n=1 Tax=Pseudooceanicola albus TaxID=2692189 RepID=A0A6L7GB82_9RHOB|nr:MULTISPECIES: dTDP-4-dehydrorhamnose 3,5-epimerase [Pseudooceanicola]MBT9386729.1 dTDP-4-dehydrorhamnose 3,5-epimerase [Pseudooceanicola endophyticus]MXN20788.1 dTDP-4-dehydrorhamnose 3,5-epimerase [Pseudooceanicola albus]
MPDIATPPLPGLLVLTPRRHADARGVFEETWNRAALARAGILTDFVQDNRSLSLAPNTVRGLHFQAPPRAQAKLVRCGRGCVLDVAVDLRRGSPTYGHWHGEELSEENGRQLLIPEGFAHGFVTREAGCELCYKCSAPYDPAAEGTLRWDDPELGIAWRLTGPAVLSERDAAAPPLRGLASPFLWEAAA